MKFSKPALSFADQLARLEARGLKIDDMSAAEQFLRRVSYYRFSAYTRAFYTDDTAEDDHKFRDDVQFEDVVALYEFDRELRLLTLSAIERIEIGFRTAASHHMCVQHGPLWFLDEKSFLRGFNHDEFLAGLQKDLGLDASTGQRREQFLDHYFKKYSQPEHPPGWMVAEILSLGTWSKIYKYLDVSDQKPIAHEVGCPSVLLESWLHSLTHVRNCCAHHSRIWNRQFTIRPKLPKHASDATLTWKDNLFAAQAVAIHELLKKLAPGECWPRRLADLFDRYPKAKAWAMGFARNWRKQAFWGITEPSASTSSSQPEVPPSS